LNYASPPPPMALPGCIPLDRRAPGEAWTSESVNSGLSSPMARNVNAIMAAVNGTKTKKRVSFISESLATTGKVTKTVSPQKRIQERKIERRPARNPYRKSQTRRHLAPGRTAAATGATAAAARPVANRVWNFPTKVEEFKKPEIEEMFRDFWKTVEEHQMEKYFADFWKLVDDFQMETNFRDFWKMVQDGINDQDHVVDIKPFWRNVEGKKRKPTPKENLAADFWRLIEKYQQRKMVDEALMVGHFLRMIETTQSGQNESRPWEAPSRDLWKLINQEEKRMNEDMISPEALAGEFFSLTGYDKRQVIHDQELTAGQFWRMIEKKKNSAEGEIKFVADSTGNVFRKFKGYEVRGKRKESMADAKMVNQFFEMVDQEQKNTESSAEIYGGDLWRMINESKNHAGEIQFTADKNGNIFKNVKGYQMQAKPKEPAVEAEWVRQFFTMVEKQQQNDEAKMESYAGNFWKMINNSAAETERKVKREAFAGDFWKMVEFSENLRRKRETMRRLSESNRAAASAPASASASASTSASAPFLATPAKAGVDHKEGARRTALLFACSTLEEQAVFLLAPEYQQTHGPGGRKRKTSSSSSSLYSVNEEEEFRAEVFSTSAATASASSSSSSSSSTPRRLFRVTPHYGQSQQLGAPKGSSDAAPKSGVIVVALRRQKKSVKPQQCHRQNMVAQERRGSITRRNRIPSVSIGSNNDRKCGKKSW